MHKLSLSTRKMDLATKRDVHWWEETVFILFWFLLQRKGIKPDNNYLVTFQHEIKAVWHRQSGNDIRKKTIYRWIFHHWMVCSAIGQLKYIAFKMFYKNCRRFSSFSVSSIKKTNPPPFLYPRLRVKKKQQQLLHYHSLTT